MFYYASHRYLCVAVIQNNYWEMIIVNSNYKWAWFVNCLGVAYRRTRAYAI